MTAEVAVLNEQAVALATDSAVTTGERKVYTSANKLFTLSKVQPVGVMIFNSASFMGVPLETIIKVFRDSIGGSSCECLTGYADRFLDFLTDKDNYLFSPKNRHEGLKKYFAYLALRDFEAIKDSRDKKFVNAAREALGQDKEPKSLATILVYYLSSLVRDLEKRDDVTGVTAEDFERAAAPHDRLLDQVIDLVFKGEDVTQASRKKLKRIVVLRAAKEWHRWSGIVVAGFGARDAFPKLTSFYIGALVEDADPRSAKLKVKTRKDKENLGDRSQIIPFAQSKEVYSFLLGIDEEYRNYLLDYWRLSLNNLIDAVVEQVSSAGVEITETLEWSLHQQATKTVGDLESAMTQVEREIADPITRNLSNLPKDELATFAESLVSLVSLKKRASTEEESVGGPIDVAVISKGDGFVWVRRKHYFRPEYNLAFAQNYFRGLGGRSTDPIPTQPEDRRDE